MGRLPVYHTKADRDAARKAATRKYHTKRRVTVQRLKGLVRLSDSQTTLWEPPQILQARALLVQARALLQELDPNNAGALLQLVASCGCTVQHESSGAYQ